MKQLSAAAVERAMKLQDVMLRAMAKRITWFQAAEILGISCRQMQRWKTRFEHEGYEGLFDRASKSFSLFFFAELGHNLGLRHGGGSDATFTTLNGVVTPRQPDAEDTPTFKPNYLSVMNYK